MVLAEDMTETLLAEAPVVAATPAVAASPSVSAPVVTSNPNAAATPVADAVVTPTNPKTPEPAATNAPPAEIVYDIKLGEKPTMDAKGLEALTAFAKDTKLSPEQAQALASRDDAMLATIQKLHVEAQDKQYAEWVAAIKADPEIGGDKLPAAMKKAEAALAKYGSPELAEAMKGPYASYAPWIRFLNKIGSAMSEDRVIQTNQPPAPPADGGFQATANALYGKKPST